MLGPLSARLRFIKDVHAPLEDRVEDLLERLSLAEKIHLLHGNISTNGAVRFWQPGVPRLDFPQIAMIDGRQDLRTMTNESSRSTMLLILHLVLRNS